MICNRCSKTVPTQLELMIQMREARKQPTLHLKFIRWWSYKDTICICAEQGYIMTILSLEKILTKRA